MEMKEESEKDSAKEKREWKREREITLHNAFFLFTPEIPPSNKVPGT